MLPLGLSRILGITTHLGIPPELPIYLMAVGALFLAVGGLLLGAARLTTEGTGTRSGADQNHDPHRSPTVSEIFVSRADGC